MVTGIVFFIQRSTIELFPLYCRSQTKFFILAEFIMHDLYYKGRIHTRHNHIKTGYNTKRSAKLGTEKHPLLLVVNSDERKLEVEALVAKGELFAEITVDSTVDEDINDLTAALNKPVTTTFDKTPNRNDPCSCGSGKKYKKCCG